VPIAAGEQTNAVAVAIDAASVIAAVSTAAAHAARAATTTMPIVGLDLETDPVAIGMIASLARPGGNLTGFFFDFAEFRGKLLELLKEIIPDLSSIAVIWDPNSGPAQLKSVQAGLEALKLKLAKFEARNASEMMETFEAAKRAGVDAVVILSSPFIGANIRMIAGLTLKHALPAVTLFSELRAVAG
jgi:putative ABC transport system substrate-binding protein